MSFKSSVSLLVRQGSSQRSQGVAGRYASRVDIPVPLRLQKRRYAFDIFFLLVFSSGRESIASESQVNKIRRARWGRCVFLILYFRRLSSSTPHRDCTVGPVTSMSNQSSRKKKVLWKFTCLSSVVEKCSTTDQYIKVDLAQNSEGWGSFRDIDGVSSERSLFPGDVSAPRRIDDKLCYFCLFILIKIVKSKTRKREWTVLVLWRRRACTFAAVIDA